MSEMSPVNSDCDSVHEPAMFVLDADDADQCQKYVQEMLPPADDNLAGMPQASPATHACPPPKAKPRSSATAVSVAEESEVVMTGTRVAGRVRAADKRKTTRFAL
jgi:hypothetical protein